MEIKDNDKILYTFETKYVNERAYINKDSIKLILAEILTPLVDKEDSVSEKDLADGWKFYVDAISPYIKEIEKAYPKATISVNNNGDVEIKDNDKVLYTFETKHVNGRAYINKNKIEENLKSILS